MYLHIHDNALVFNNQLALIQNRFWRGGKKKKERKKEKEVFIKISVWIKIEFDSAKIFGHTQMRCQAFRKHYIIDRCHKKLAVIMGKC